MGRNLDTAGNDFGRLRQVGASAANIPQIDMTQATTPMRPVQASGLHPKRMPTPSDIALHIRRMLKLGGSAEHAKGVQWFFKEEIKSHGWYTGGLRRAAVRAQREIRNHHEPDFLLKVADCLFSGQILEEKIFAVLMLCRISFYPTKTTWSRKAWAGCCEKPPKLILGGRFPI